MCHSSLCHYTECRGAKLMTVQDKGENEEQQREERKE
jgi:hypothetical protein